MIIQHDLASMTTARQMKINNSDNAKSSEKLSSGYRINRAADDAAGLTVSENMRYMIRGLLKGVKNAGDGIDFIDIGDGAMSEIESMLHKMRELTIQSLNDTNTAADRMAMEGEFESLQSEIDNICENTQYNTINVFDDHDPSFYQIKGNINWSYDQLHEIDVPGNELNIVVGSTEYTVTVPKGNYTTQELIDEIDSAFLDMDPNPGLSLEFTKTGRCNVNLEGGVDIDSVSGGLAYLIYGSYDGGSYGSLLGTTAFVGDYPLTITSENNTITFYTESLVGGGESEVTLKLKDGNYSKEELIDLINEALDDCNIFDIRASEYGDNSIQMSSLESIVTGLKGNMFKLETSGPIYTSVFYDNVKYGNGDKDAANLSGTAYYNSSYTENFVITAGVNDTMRVKLNGAADYTEIKIAPSGKNGYTISQLKEALNNGIKNAGLESELVCSTAQKYVSSSGIPYTYYDYLTLETKKTGTKSSIEVDQTDAVSKAAFDTLFTTTNISYTKTAYRWDGGDNRLVGTKNLPKPINIGNNKTLYFSVGSKDYSVVLSKSSYADAAELAADIEKNLPSYLSDKIHVTTNGSRLVLEEKTKGILNGETISGPVEAGHKDLYYELFVGEGQERKWFDETGAGSIKYTQGSTEPVSVSQASVTLPYPIPKDSISVTSSNNSFVFRMKEPGKDSYSIKKISLTPKSQPYTKDEFIEEMNKQLKEEGYPISASISGGALKLTTTYQPVGNSQDFGLELYYGDYGSNSIMNELVGTDTVDNYPSSSHSKSYVQGYKKITGPFEIDNTNDTLTFNYGGKEITVTVPNGTYSNGADIAAALQKELDEYKDADGKNVLKDQLEVTDNGSGIRIESKENGTNFKATSSKGNFYTEVLCNKISEPHDGKPVFEDGKSRWDDAYTVGRQDIRNTETEIIKGLNDEFIIDFNYPDPDHPGDMKAVPLKTTIPEGIYSGDELAAILQPALNAQLQSMDIGKDFTIKATVGGHSTSIVGNNDANALQFTLQCDPDANVGDGSYYLDGVRGSSAYIIFYKNTGLPKESFVLGEVDLRDGVSIEAGKNTFSFTVDGKDYTYEIPEGDYTSDEIVDKLNELIQKPDASGKSAPVRAAVENGVIKLTHNGYGRHPITNITGTAKGTIFYEEEGRTDQDARMLQVGARKGDDIELTRVVLNTNFMKINSATISKPKYAEKALQRLDYALDYLNKQRSKWGALHNRLDKAMTVGSLTTENTQSAESRYRDTDYADEKVKNAKSQILLQAGQAVMAQNRASANKVLQLLQ